MTDPITKITSRARQVRLSEQEKQERKERFQHYMAATAPSRTGWLSRVISWRVIASPVPYVATLMLLVLAGGSLSYSAQSTLPGDTLYPIKVSINEELQGMLYAGPESKAVYEAYRATQRLREMESLVGRDSINTTTLKEVSANLEAHIASIKAYTADNTASSTPGSATGTAATSTDRTAHIATTSRALATTSPALATSTDMIGTTTIRSQATGTATSVTAHKQRSRRNLQVLREHVTRATSSLKRTERQTLATQLSRADRHVRRGMQALERDKRQAALTAFIRAQRLMRAIQTTLERRAATKPAMTTLGPTPRASSTAAAASSTATTPGTTNAATTTDTHASSSQQTATSTP